MALTRDGLAKESRLAQCVHEIVKHERGDLRARYTLAAWIEELELVLALPDDHRYVNGPIDGPTAER
jgi:hypothetical protein